MIYTTLTKKAMKIAYEAHKNQVDKAGTPYIFHPIHLAEQMKDESSTIVALLHDVVEDTDITFEDLQKEGFPLDVIEALKVLTFDETAYFKYSKDDRLYDEVIKRMNREKYIDAIKNNDIARAVKICDLEHNRDLTRLDNITKEDKSRCYKYEKEWIDLKICEIRKNCNHNYEDMFFYTYPFVYIGSVFTIYQGVLQQKFYHDNDIDEYNVLKDIFEKSQKFEKIEHAYFKTGNGKIRIEYEPAPFEYPIANTIYEGGSTFFCLSNIEKDFIDDIIDAFENYFGFKIYCCLNVTRENHKPIIYFSSEEIK